MARSTLADEKKKIVDLTQAVTTTKPTPTQQANTANSSGSATAGSEKNKAYKLPTQYEKKKLKPTAKMIAEGLLKLIEVGSHIGGKAAGVDASVDFTGLKDEEKEQLVDSLVFVLHRYAGAKPDNPIWGVVFALVMLCLANLRVGGNDVGAMVSMFLGVGGDSK